MNISILITVVLFFVQLNAFAKNIILPADLVVPVYFDKPLMIDRINTTGSTTVSPVKDIVIAGEKIFTTQSIGYAKVVYKKMNVLLYSQTSFGRASVTIPEITLYDTFNNPHRFVLSKKIKKIKKVKFTKRTQDLFNILIPGSFSEIIIDRNKIFYAHMPRSHSK